MKKETVIRKPSKLLKVLHYISFAILVFSIVNIITKWVFWWAIIPAILAYGILSFTNTKISIIEETPD